MIDDPRGAPRRPRRDSGDGEGDFQRAFTGSVVVLAVLCLVFLGLTTFQGPKLASAVVDPALVVQQPGQQLRLFTNQAVAQVAEDQVTITPAAPFTVSTDGDVISIEFEQSLHYGTDYVVEVSDVTSPYQERPATLRHEFRTEPETVHLLDRAEPGSGEQDVIQAGELTAEGLTGLVAVYRDERILDFVVAGQALAVVTEAASDDHRLSIVSLFDGAVEEIELPGAGTLDELQANSGFAVGFRFTSAGDPLAREYAQTLFWMDLEGAHTPSPVHGLTGDSLSVSDWAFVPPQGAIAALATDQSLLLIDPRGEDPAVPLGIWEGLDDISADGSTAIVRDLYDTIVLSLADGSAEPFGPSPIDGVVPFGGEVELLQAGPARVQKVSVYDPEAGVFVSRVVADDGVESRSLFLSESGAGSIDEISVSPNGQFVAVEFVPDVATAVSDAYYPFARADTIRTVLVDIATGRRVADVPGFGIAW
ncbi:hypothetical protein OH146_02570 [Salinibacterium sp. SYSU T00001]|uniref:hypothetical protein n=1 Tax=Homoserinimonas sedimenticola TaxID=2986805 RepID=UPI0022366F9A|nr:hypothetical protein [Salinibacterium sedimenticola]MCW4384653.1 hypothetical protein [Salinibacterium sedimenticola]